MAVTCCNARSVLEGFLPCDKAVSACTTDDIYVKFGMKPTTKIYQYLHRIWKISRNCLLKQIIDHDLSIRRAQ